MEINEFIQPNNPTYEERDNMLKSALEEVERIEDYNNIKELLGPQEDITNIIPPGRGKGIKVGIIGGGVAGLSSAFELRKLGFNITIFEEQKERVGGRIYTYYFDKDKKMYGELGAMRIPVSHGTTWYYIDTFGLETRPFVQENENGIIYIRNKRARNDPEGRSVMKNIYPEFNLSTSEKNISWQEILSYALESELDKLDTSTKKELLQIKKEYSPKIKELGAISTRKVMAGKGLSEGAIELLSYLAPLIGYLYYGSYIENLQDQYIVNDYYRYYIKGGLSKLPISFYNSLTSKNPKEYISISNSNLGKVKWMNGRTVTGIYKIDEKNKVRIKYREGKSLETYCEDFDYIICAIPFSSLRSVEIYPMFTPEKMQAIKELGYEAAQKTLFLCNNSFWEEGNKNERIIGGNSRTDLIISSIWYPNNHLSKNIEISKNKKKHKKHKNYKSWSNPGVLLASYNLNLDSVRLGNIDENIGVELIKRQVEKVHGLPKGYLDSIVESYKTIEWDHEQGFYGGISHYREEQQNLFAYASQQPEYDERVYFAGEHISQTHAWIQGALSTGMKAANRIAEHYKYKAWK
ncbi:flavin monoamine oxidase family protein [Clostridium botulinum]|uniref:Flavin containing amine oxidoreductase n=1 Tax=Clostridium botulinum (strain Hall / ATCC 3502 / NCTC 13319 / Type A) TaxID=441771 RepID=A5I134_CLOBH|nr:FAD-dependent oxidoreductase [Clostridium botulinum]ABS34266.1 amine oxidase, flavin-containing [Clostridium botulinum A str. ATCC 19397]ABS37848.1 amine oxidase, flavin-containing [Clostridium botulinum A str. Hall]AWB17111.1 amine oxidase [Clostridium botulinum]AWB29908.1 amine oxidase [Clostridium botulinum]EGT5617274.1 amine oxidase [Clostridium botulinum]